MFVPPNGPTDRPEFLPQADRNWPGRIHLRRQPSPLGVILSHRTPTHPTKFVTLSPPPIHPAPDRTEKTTNTITTDACLVGRMRVGHGEKKPLGLVYCIRISSASSPLLPPRKRSHKRTAKRLRKLHFIPLTHPQASAMC